MTKVQRILRVFEGIMMLLCAVLLNVAPFGGYVIVIVILALSLINYAFRRLIFYFTMARYMVGGRSILYSAVIILDFGILMLGFVSLPGIYLAIYLGVIHLVSGGVDIYNAIDAKKLGSSLWLRGAVVGAINIVIAFVAIVAGLTTKSVQIFVVIYSIGLVYSAIIRIVSAFRKTAIVYIQ